MVERRGKPWSLLSRAERRDRLEEIFMALEIRERCEPAPRTTGEFWKSAGYLKRATVLAAVVLGAEFPTWVPKFRDGRVSLRNAEFGCRRGFVAIRGDIQDNTWQAFWRTTVENQTAADAGSALGMSKAAVRQAKARVLRRLKEEVGDLIA